MAYQTNPKTGAINYAGTLTSAYESALERFRTQRKDVQRGFLGAEEPLQETADMFRPGGTYGAGQIAKIEAGGRGTLATGMSHLTATGMSSGTNVTGLRARVGADVTQAKLGVEDVRVGHLANALAMLSQLRGQGAGTAATMREPEYGPYTGAMTSLYGTSRSASANRFSALTNLQGTREQIASKERTTQMQIDATKPQVTQHFETPW